MSNPEDFVIENGILKKYVGPGGDVVIPEGVFSIDSAAFFGRRSYNLTSVTIPKTVSKIGEYLFSECKQLTSIVIPDSVTEIGNHAFEYCSSLNHVVIPKGVTTIGDWSFFFCTSMTNLTIPESVTRLGTCAFWGCNSLTSLVIPDSINEINSSTFYMTSLHYLRVPNHADIDRYTFDNLPLQKVDCDFNIDRKLPIAYSELLPYVSLDAAACASLIINQTSALWHRGIFHAIEVQNIDRNEIMEMLAVKIANGKKPSAALQKQLSEFIQIYIDALDPAALQKILDALQKKKSKLFESLQSNSDIIQKLQNPLPVCQNPILKLTSENFKMSEKLIKVKDSLSEGIAYSNENGLCPVNTILLILSECLDVPGNEQLDQMDYHYETFPHSFSEIADQVVAGLAQDELMKVMKQLIDTDLFIPAVLVLGRYGASEDVKYITAKMEEWKTHKSSKTCKRNRIIGRSALMQNKSHDAAIYFQKEHQLQLYAEHLNLDSRDLWFSYVLDFSLDDSGKRKFLLSNKELELTINPDFSVELRDQETGAVMKRIPSKGIDSEEYKHFHTQISDFKKDLKSAVKSGINMLLEDFLSGAELPPAQWKARYHCFISHTLAKNLLWRKVKIPS